MKTKKIIALMLAVISVIPAFSINGFAVAIPLEAGNSMETAAEIPEYGVEYVGSLSSSVDEAWYKFTTDSDDAYYRVQLINYSLPEGLHYFQNCYLQLLDVYGKDMGSFHGRYGDGYLSKKLDNNTTYYIKITHEQAYEKGNFEICVSLNYDSVPNVMDKAVDTEINMLISNSLNGYADIDWFKFTAPVTGDYEIIFDNCELDDGSSSPSRCANIALLDCYSQTLASGYTQFGENAVLRVTLEQDEIYYIKICMGGSASASIGKYAFIINSPLKETVLIDSISIIAYPQKTTYYIGETFDATGLEVSANYSDGTSVDINDYTVTGFDSSSAGEKDIVVTYAKDGVTHTCSFKINVVERVVKNLSKIYIYSTPYKTTYTIGDTFDKTGLSVMAYYSDGTTKIVTGYTIGGFDSSKAGTNAVIISYTENGITKACTFNVEIVAPERKLESISVHTMPNKTVYQVGEGFDETGIVVYAYYSDGTYEAVEGYYFRNFDSSVAGTNTVTVIYSENGIEKSTAFDVTIEEAPSESFFTMIINAIINFFLSLFSIFSF